MCRIWFSCVISAQKFEILFQYFAQKYVTKKHNMYKNMFNNMLIVSHGL
jgi:hypothetical protein